MLLGPGKERQAVDHLFRVKDWSEATGYRPFGDGLRPNRRMVWMADQALGRQGELLASVLDAFRGVYLTPFDPVQGAA